MAHSNYYLDLCVDTYVVNGDAVLLRLHEKYDIWNAPGGHIDPGEDVNEAALREVWEEVGLKVSLVGPADWEQKDTETNRDLIPPLFVNRHFVTDTHEHSSIIFAAKADSREINPQTEADKGAECRWLTQTELDDLLKDDSRMRPEVHRYASTALRLVRD
ncbi:MAG: NUDIX domain-containing protein [Candidatus Paceibacterota bacterium]